jgi:hypothetical protein
MLGSSNEVTTAIELVCVDPVSDLDVVGTCEAEISVVNVGFSDLNDD